MGLVSAALISFVRCGSEGSDPETGQFPDSRQVGEVGGVGVQIHRQAEDESISNARHSAPLRPPRHGRDVKLPEISCDNKQLLSSGTLDKQRSSPLTWQAVA